MVLFIRIVLIIGFLLSLYSIITELKKKRDKDYKAVCDIRGNVSCSVAFSSKYGKIFGVSNSYFGLIFYALVFLLTYINLSYVFYLSILSIIGTIYLAYVSYFKLKNFCLICHGIYVVNILILIFSYIEGF